MNTPSIFSAAVYRKREGPREASGRGGNSILFPSRAGSGRYHHPPTSLLPSSPEAARGLSHTVPVPEEISTRFSQGLTLVLTVLEAALGRFGKK